MVSLPSHSSTCYTQIDALQALLLKSYEGRIGCRYPELNFFVTSPNMDKLPDSILGPQNIRLRQQLHYGTHDPCLVPQPFNTLTPHLPLIRFPGGPQMTTMIFWFLPPEEEFEAIDGHKLSLTPLGRISSHYLSQLKHQYHEILTSATSSSSSVNGHPKIREYRTRIRVLFDRLTTPATFQQASMLWRLAQCNCLEMEAKIIWLRDVQPTFTVENALRVHPLRDVVGAVTDRLEIVEYCYRVSLSDIFFSFS